MPAKPIDNERRACGAVVRVLEERRGAVRANGRSPEDERVGPPVEYVFDLGGRTYALEHTVVEAFDGQIHKDVDFAAFVGLLAAALLRDRGKTGAHLACLAQGAKAVPRERRRARDIGTRLVAQLEGVAAAAKLGLEQHDRWALARMLLLRKLDGRRSTSRLPALIEYVAARPIVSAGMIADELGVTPRAAQNLVAELGLREATGGGRYRAWGIL